VPGKNYLTFKGEKISFSWILTHSKWDNVLELFGPFLKEINGFQWLDNSAGVSLLISNLGCW
jgi:hypothetical protein